MKHVRTTADAARFGVSVRIDCRECHAARTMSGAEMVRTCGAVPLANAAARLRCARCGAKEARVVVLVPV